MVNVSRACDVGVVLKFVKLKDFWLAWSWRYSSRPTRPRQI
jgi:hypothetical protein